MKNRKVRHRNGEKEKTKNKKESHNTPRNSEEKTGERGKTTNHQATTTTNTTPKQEKASPQPK